MHTCDARREAVVVFVVFRTVTAVSARVYSQNPAPVPHEGSLGPISGYFTTANASLFVEDDCDDLLLTIGTRSRLCRRSCLAIGRKYISCLEGDFPVLREGELKRMVVNPCR
jgi:hypothetical protein